MTAKESGAMGVWGAITGVAPHVLHHVGPLAGTAFLAGFGGKALFAAIALITSMPLLVRLFRRFRTWVAPAVALAVMAGAFAVSTLVIGPALTDGRSSVPAPEETEHEEHGH